MQDLNKALADIADIRLQLEAGTMFRGFGPAVIAITGLMALGLASVQFFAFEQAMREPALFLAAWSAVALAAAGLIGVEMFARTRRHHSGLADAMLFKAVENFLPMAAAGAAVGFTLLHFAPDTTWLLPGLWQILVSLGLFTAVRFLPRAVVLAAAWYFISGIVVMALTASQRELTPWAMGLPFGIGQLLLAAILRVAYGDEDGSA